MALKSKLGKIASGLAAALDPAVKAAAETGKATRDRLVPVDTGALKASGAVVRVDSAHYQIREGDGLPDARAAYTEYGTAKAPAQPHMTPAATTARGALSTAMGNAVKAAVRKG
jgi:HK97 gp10 family phage protein